MNCNLGFKEVDFCTISGTIYCGKEGIIDNYDNFHNSYLLCIKMLAICIDTDISRRDSMLLGLQLLSITSTE